MLLFMMLAEAKLCCWSVIGQPEMGAGIDEADVKGKAGEWVLADALLRAVEAIM